MSKTLQETTVQTAREPDGDEAKEMRWVSIASSIKSAVRRGELHAGARLASSMEMARQWNVSPMTVHRALTELQREGWVVRRRKAGTVVADRPALPVTKVALIFTSLSGLPQGAYLSSIEEGLAEGYQILPFGTRDDPREEARCLERAARECSAIVCYPTGAPENTPLLRSITAKLPVVFVDRVPEGLENVDSVMTDNLGSMQQGLQHLRSLGHTRIAYFMEDRAIISSVRERYTGYQKFLQQECGVSDPERWVRRVGSTLPRDQYCGYVETALAEILQGPDRITAVACQQDATLTAVIEACVRLGISFPDELAILSFSDAPIPLTPLVRGVHRLVQRPEEMGNIAAKRIHLRLASPDLPPQVTRLTTDLYPASIPPKYSRTALDFIQSRKNLKKGTQAPVQK
jgi:DNA-binding LacI/PurR family transcriptional regulator